MSISHLLAKRLRGLMDRMPIDLILVRHGESLGNKYHHNLQNQQGDQNPEEIIGVPGFLWNLTELGVSQAQSAGEFLRNYIDWPVHGITSPYKRTIETASNLSLGIQWEIRNAVRERDWGQFDPIVNQDDYNKMMELINNCLDGHWMMKPPGGESILEVIDRVSYVNSSLARNHGDHHVVIVSHGEFIRSMAASYFHWSLIEQEKYEEEYPWLVNPANCQIIHFTRRVSETSRRLSESFCRVRSIVPYDFSHRNNQLWIPVVSKKYSDQDLQQLCQKAS